MATTQEDGMLVEIVIRGRMDDVKLGQLIANWRAGRVPVQVHSRGLAPELIIEGELVHFSTERPVSRGSSVTTGRQIPLPDGPNQGFVGQIL